MAHIHHVEVAPRSLESLQSASPEAVARAEASLRRGGELLGQRRLWNVNSTARGGGVAELLASLVAFARGAGLDVRWVTLTGDEPFFRITKRLHHALHGARGDGSPLDQEARARYEAVQSRNATELCDLVAPDDVVLLHDPQTAGLAAPLAKRGCVVVWRCHIGQDETSAEAEEGWAFLGPYLQAARAFVFSREAYVPVALRADRCRVIAPSIDPLATKNRDLEPEAVRAIMVRAGLLRGEVERRPEFRRSDGSTAEVTRTADVVRFDGAPPAEVPTVVQVSRWDPLKDSGGVLRGFARMVESGRGGDAQLMLVGPQVDGVTDDPEGASTHDGVVDVWRRLPAGVRERVHLVSLPMDDLEENAAMVNAIQRHASVVVQKSLREGFGLTVTEAMWKARPVLASRVGGIQDQIEHDRSGVLLANPRDLEEFAARLADLLEGSERAQRIGAAARLRVRDRFLPDRHLAEYADLLATLARI